MHVLYRIAIGTYLLFSAAHGVDIPDGFNKDVCTPSTSTSKVFPTLPQTYLSKIEWNDNDRKQTYFMQEFVDVEKNLGTIYITGYEAPGVTSKFITSAPTKELFVIRDAGFERFQDTNCFVEPLSEDDDLALPFTSNKKFGNYSIVGGSGLLRLGASPVGKASYAGTDSVNGILCDKWEACLFVKGSMMTIKATYYFSYEGSDGSWAMPGMNKPVPVMIAARGKSSLQGQPPINQDFNYHYFSDAWPTADLESFYRIFETPMHAFCPGRRNMLVLPTVPSQFSFRAEILDSINDVVQYTRELYDFQANYTRMDFKVPPTGNLSVDLAVSPETIINDFNTGVTYLIDKYSGTCVCIPIQSNEFDSVGLSNHQVRMRSPKEFFDMDNLSKYPYQYMGKHVIRGVNTNSWISYRPYPNEASDLNATWEWYFATNQTLIKAADQVENLEPIRANIKSVEANVDMTYNIYKFVEEAPDLKHFRVDACYSDSGSLGFELQLAGNWSRANAPNNIQMLEYWFRLSVEAFGGIRSIRVQDIEFEFYEENIVARFTILGPALVKGDVKNNIKQTSLSDARDYLAEAIESGQFLVYFMSDASPQSTTLKPVPGTLRIIERKQHPGEYRPADDPLQIRLQQGPGLSAGRAVGLAFGMLLLGALLGVIAIYVFNKKTATNVPYQREALKETE